MILNRQTVIDRLKNGEKLKESGNSFLFADGNSISASTEIWLRKNNLIFVSGGLAHRTIKWIKKDLGIE